MLNHIIGQVTSAITHALGSDLAHPAPEAQHHATGGSTVMAPPGNARPGWLTSLMGIVGVAEEPSLARSRKLDISYGELAELVNAHPQSIHMKPHSKEAEAVAPLSKERLLAAERHPPAEMLSKVEPPELQDKFVGQLAKQLYELFHNCDDRYKSPELVEKVLRERMANPDALLFVVHENGELRSSISVVNRDKPDFLYDPELKHPAYNYYFADFASFKEGQGYGTRVFADAQLHLLDTNLENIHLYTEDQQEMYARRGFGGVKARGEQDTGWRALRDDKGDILKEKEDDPIQMALIMRQSLGQLRGTLQNTRNANALAERERALGLGRFASHG